MKFTGLKLFSLSSGSKVTPKKAGKESSVGGGIKDFFTYTPREADSHERFFQRLGMDLKHSAPFVAKIGAVGVGAGLLAGALIGASALLAIGGGVAGMLTAASIADKATSARDMKELAGIAGWNLPVSTQ